MNKRLIILVSSDPTHPEIGYGDHFELISGDNEPILGGHCSSCPNPYRISDGTSWKELYDWIASGQYTGQVVRHPKYGKCILLNHGGEVASRNPVPNLDGSIFKEVFCHVGALNSQNPEWRGSLGCITFPRDIFPKVMGCFEVNESVIIDVVDFFNNTGGKMGLKEKIREIRAEKRARLDRLLNDIAKTGKNVAPEVLEVVAEAAKDAIPTRYDQKKNDEKTVQGAIDGLIATGAAAGAAVTVKAIMGDSTTPELENAIAGLIAALVGALVAGIRRRIQNRRKIEAKG